METGKTMRGATDPRHVDRACLAAGLMLCVMFWIGGLRIAAEVVQLPPDAVYYGIVARNLIEGQGFTMDVVGLHIGYLDETPHVPLLHGFLQSFALAAQFWLFEVALRQQTGLSMTWAALTGVVVLLFARRLFGPLAGLGATLLFLTSPALFLYSFGGADDVGFAFLFTGCLFAMTESIERQRASLFVWAGVLAALAILQKLMGLFLPAMFLTPILLRPETGRRLVMRWLVPAAIPGAIAVSIYLLRNWLAYGSIEFRFGQADWLLKTGGYGAANWLIENPLSTGDMMRELGAARVWGLVREQLHAWLVLVARPLMPGPLGHAGVFPSLIAPVWGPFLGMLGVGVLLRRKPSFAVPSALAIVGGMLFVCIPYHVDGRYFLYLAPLLSISLAGGLATVARAAPPVEDAGRQVEALVWARRIAVSLLVCLLLVGIAPGLVKLMATPFESRPEVDPSAGAPLACVSWSGEHLPANARLLAFHPWGLNWHSRRSVINTPGGGVQAIQKVVEHYGVDHIVVSESSRRGAFQSVRKLVKSPPEGWEAERLFEQDRCAVYRYGRRQP